MIKTNLLILLLVFYSCNPEPDPQQEGTLQPVSAGEMIEHTYFSLAYSEANEGALWVFYHLTPEHINGPGVRKDNFKVDPLVLSGSAALEDYVGSGYDRGHLCPAASMTINQTAMDESFYLSKMLPQHLSCNKGYAEEP
jgi:endonuclease G, mitochondrial